MKVLIISTYDQQGGAAIAAYRLLEALNKNGVTATMLTLHKASNHHKIKEVGNYLFNKTLFVAERASIFRHNDFSRKNLFDISIANTGVSITNRPEFKEADVIHLHWINQGMLSVRELGKIVASGKKIVWTMHDMWPFTGICHHSAKCNGFEDQCGNCPYLQTPTKNDISHATFLRKQAAYSFGNIHFVACSNWLKELAVKSPLTRGEAVSSIANPINTKIYYPKDKVALRKEMNLPIDKKIILFAAAKVSDQRKGTDYLIEASKILSKQDNNYMFLIAGGNSEEIISKLSLPALSAGYVASSNMPNLYNVSNVFVTPSLQENLPNTIMESMSCGTPCVGFEIGGIPEMIDHTKNGYVATYKNSQDLADGLLWVLEESSNDLSENARNKVLQHYAEKAIVKRYIEIYTRKERTQ